MEQLNGYRPQMLSAYATMPACWPRSSWRGDCGSARRWWSPPGLRLFEDLVIFEVVNDGNRPVAPGTFGSKLLVTVVNSRTLPLIRYQLSDSLRLAADRCPCGRPFALADGIQGRAEEILRFPARAGGQVRVHPVVIHQVMDAAGS